MYQTYIAIEALCAGFSGIIFVSGLASSTKSRSKKYMSAMMFAFSLACIVDLSTWLLLGKPQYFSILKVVWVLDKWAISCCLISFHYYIINYINERVRISSVLRVIIWPITLGVNIVWSLSLKTEWFYYFDENLVYHYGPFHWISQLSEAMILLIDLFILIRFWKKIERKALLAFSSYILFPIITIPIGEKINSAIMIYISIMLSGLLIYITVTEEKEKQLVKQEAELKDMKIKLMLSQIRPHFIFNTLNSIYYLCDVDVRKAQQEISDFSDYLRGNIDALSAQTAIPLEKELVHTKAYLELELVRYDHRFEVEYDIETMDFKIPALSIQPIVENAVKHGLRRKKSGGWVRISSREYEDCYEVVISDNGCGFDPDKIQEDGKMHVGISNIKNRLDLYGKMELKIESQIGVGTKVTIRIEK